MIERLSIERLDDVVHLVLDAPERRNALSRSMLSGLISALGDVDGSVRGAVISGRDGFSAGADLREITGTSSDIGFDDAVAAATEAIRGVPRLVVAAVEGPCIGAAADLGLACDFRVVAEGSYIQIPAMRLGVLYNPETLARLEREFPLAALRRLLLLGERFEAREALEVGLASHLAPQGEAVSVAVGLLEGVTPSAIEAAAATKAFFNRHEEDATVSKRWQELRRDLLDSPSRKAALAEAKKQTMGRGDRSDE